MRVTLLGTGCPIVDVHRYGPATLVEAGPAPTDEAWLIDCGSGVTQRLLEHGRGGAQLTGLLLTHLHSDHVVDFIQLLISGWHQGRTQPLRVYGPRRTKEFLHSLWEAWHPEFLQRAEYEFRPATGLEILVEEIPGNWTLQTPQFRISNTEVWHQPIPQAFGFRFDTSDGSAVVSGDTAYCPPLAELARYCDLLVHEAFVHWQFEALRKNADPRQRDHVRKYHTTTLEVGHIAHESQARHVALTHWVPPAFDPARVLEDVRQSFGGDVSLGEDLMRFEIREHRVQMFPPAEIRSSKTGG